MYLKMEILTSFTWVVHLYMSAMVLALPTELCLPRQEHSDKAGRLRHTLLPRTICSLAHFADSYFAHKNILQPNTFFSLNTLLSETLCLLKHFAPWNTLLTGTFCSFVKCSPQHTMLSGTQKAKCSKKQSVPWSKVCWGEKYSREQSVLRSKMCWGVKCVRE